MAVAEKGKRKFQLLIVCLTYALIGLLAVAVIKADANLFYAFIGGVLGLAGVTNNGYKAEYKMQGGTEVAKVGSEKAGA